eukprot:TRINITY_DN262_c0_g1_i1.p1 TRINITY_DN262_c0_g1~~TRINITY_DN262_c0_g1_i1.p1  ORF type:complete len:132 (+),score=28.26 TRINITY_DN262_c0_g1_i1:73-468(+)
MMTMKALLLVAVFLYACVVVASAAVTFAPPPPGNFSGRATYYNQGGAAGACGQKHSDTDHICALPTALYRQGHCGKKVSVTNTANKKNVEVIVADECPGCGASSLDLSVGAFEAIGSRSSGVLQVNWEIEG